HRQVDAEPRGADDLPGPLCLTGSADAGRVDPRRAPGRATNLLARRTTRAHLRAATGRGTCGSRGRFAPAGILRRTTAADRVRPGARAPSKADRCGRAGIRARCLHPRAVAEPDATVAGGARPDVPDDQSRPFGRAL